MNQFKNLNKILRRIVGIIFVILIGLVLYTFYRSEILYDGLNRDYYLKYYIFLISSILILFFINFLNEKIKSKIYIILILIIVGLYVSETLLINFKNLKSKTKYQFYVDIKQKQDVVVAIHPLHFILQNIGKKELFPLSGVAKKLTIFCINNENSNSSSDPIFTTESSSSDVPTTDFDTSLQNSSPAIDSGYDDGWSEDLCTDKTDLAGNPRCDGTIDMGAYEYTE